MEKDWNSEISQLGVLWILDFLDCPHAYIVITIICHLTTGCDNIILITTITSEMIGLVAWSINLSVLLSSVNHVISRDGKNRSSNYSFPQKQEGTDSVNKILLV